MDPDGRKLYFASGVSEKFKRQFAATISYMNECGTAGDIARLESSHVVYYIGEADITPDHWLHFNIKTKTIKWDPNRICQSDTGIQVSPATTLAHEAAHAAQYDAVLNSGNEETVKQWKESLNHDKNNKYGSSEEERVITTTEQEAAQKHGEIRSDQVTRTSHRDKGDRFIIPDGTPPHEVSRNVYEHNKNL